MLCCSKLKTWLVEFMLTLPLSFCFYCYRFVCLCVHCRECFVFFLFTFSFWCVHSLMLCFFFHLLRIYYSSLLLDVNAFEFEIINLVVLCQSKKDFWLIFSVFCLTELLFLSFLILFTKMLNCVKESKNKVLNILNSFLKYSHWTI